VFPEDRQRQGSGPVVWAAIIAATCLLLYFLQHVLWLVVPFLLALILYYFLYPPVHRLVYRGMGRDRAASMVMLAFVIVLTTVLLLVAPMVAGHALDWQASVERYVNGGTRFLALSLRGMEGSWSVLAKARLADRVAERMGGGQDALIEHLEPIALGIAAWTPVLLLAPFLAYFFLRDGQRFKRFLGHAVPNAFFEKTLDLLHDVDQTAKAYFQGLLKLTVLDTVTLALGLWVMGFNGALALGLICAVLAWIPYLGTILGGLLVVLVAATDFPETPVMAYWAIALFGVARLLDDFVYMPLTLGKSLHMHPLVTVLMIFAGGAVAGIPGLMLVLPVLGVVRVIGETVGVVVTDPRLMARHRYAKALEKRQASADLGT
jgi:predicted PurR-regulated permease PerM